MSGVTHGLIFGPLAFIIYINDADVSNFADDIKISKVIELIRMPVFSRMK